NASYVVAEIARQLAGSTASPEKKIRARAEVNKEGPKWRLRLIIDTADQHGERMLDAESCRAAADATALILAMTVDPTRAFYPEASALQTATTTAVPTATPTPTPTSGPPPTPTPSRTPTSTPSPTPPPSPTRAPGEPLFALSAILRGDTGTFDSP